MISILIPALTTLPVGQTFYRRLFTIYLSYASVMILLSICYEVSFYVFFSCTLCLWLELERRLYSNQEMEPLISSVALNMTKSKDSFRSLSPSFSPLTRSLVGSDLRLASYFLFFINVAFFGTGNLASLASFSLESVYRFITTFWPEAMGALLIFKLFIPFFILSAIYNVMARSLDLPPFSLFLLALSTTDVMTLNFFFLVRDDGSWMEIGTSISHFVIASAFVVFNVILFVVSWFLVGKIEVLGSKLKRRAD